jgi:hypothetical protein
VAFFVALPCAPVSCHTTARDLVVRLMPTPESQCVKALENRATVRWDRSRRTAREWAPKTLRTFFSDSIRSSPSAISLPRAPKRRRGWRARPCGTAILRRGTRHLNRSQSKERGIYGRRLLCTEATAVPSRARNPSRSSGHICRFCARLRRLGDRRPVVSKRHGHDLFTGEERMFAAKPAWVKVKIRALRKLKNAEV